MKISVLLFLVLWMVSTACSNHSDNSKKIDAERSYVSTTVNRSDSLHFRYQVQGKWKDVRNGETTMVWKFGLYDVEIDGYEHYYQRRGDTIFVSTIPYLIRSSTTRDSLLLENGNTHQKINLLRVSE